MVYSGVADAARRLGTTCGNGTVASAWFTPREGTEEPDGWVRPFPLAVSPDHAANVDAQIALHAQ